MEQAVFAFAALIAGLAGGAALVWSLLRGRSVAAAERARADAQLEMSRVIADLREKLGAAQSTAEGHASRIQALKDELAALNARHADVSGRLSSSAERIAELTTSLDAERRQFAEQVRWANEQKEELSSRFKALANDVLEEKSKRFAEQNQASLGALLEPLRIRLQEFQGKVEEVYVTEGKDRTALAEQVRQLMALNQQLSQDAHNLTSALKGQSKAQGNWGEVILERVLESSGLVKGLHYEAQKRHAHEDRIAQPDVIIRLPEGRSLVVDSKVSLNAYEEYASADQKPAREEALKRHLDSIRAHIKSLSAKNYQQIYGLNSIDFVLMFVPVEPAFLVAIAEDGELWREAWNRNVILVSPSTTLFVLRTVAHLWRQEQQSKNAQDIARRGSDLYDKFVGFVDDLQELGKRLSMANQSYDTALSKLANGRGNLIRQAEMLRELGVKPSKTLPQALIELSTESDAVDSADAPKKVA